MAFVQVDSTHGDVTSLGEESRHLPRRLTFSDRDHATLNDRTGNRNFLRIGRREEMANALSPSFLSAGKSSITGFVISGTRDRWVMIRVIGPALAAFGAANPLSDPKLRP